MNTLCRDLLTLINHMEVIIEKLEHITLLIVG
jgi:hypothetical protein